MNVPNSMAPVSKIPLPSSNPSRLSVGPRHSLGPARNVKQTSTNAGPYSAMTNEFASMNLQNSSSESRGRMSIAPRQSIDPKQSSRRSSVYGRPQNAPVILKDPRNIRDKSFQLACIKTLLDFLMQSNYHQQISPKLLSSPSAKDFQNIFKFLYEQIDPTYVFTKKFEEEVPVLMKGLRYPFAGEISKSQLAAVGSMHAWPSLLAMLIWMIELILCSEQITLQNDEIESKSSSPEKIFYEYLRKSYQVFMEGNDNFDSMLNELAVNFEKKNSIAKREIEQLNKAIGLLQEELRDLTSKENTVAGLEKEKGVYLSDIDKFKKFIKHLETKKQKFIEVIEKQKEELKTIDTGIQELEEEKALLQVQVDAQQISPEDIDRMNSEKDQLYKILEGINLSKDEYSKLLIERENVIFKKIDLVEKLVHDYNFAGEKIGVIPEEARNANGTHFEVSLNINSAKADGMINVNIKRTIIPALVKLKETFNRQFHMAQEDLCSLQEKLDRLSELSNDKNEDLLRLEEKLRRFVAQYSEEKDSITYENRQSSEEMEKLETELARMKSDLTCGFLLSQQNVQKCTIEHDQLVRRINDEKDKIGKEIFKILEELINFKTHIENSTTDFEQMVKKEYQNAK